MIGDYFTLAIKNVRHKGLRSWLTILGILIGIMSVVALISLGNGLKLAVNSQFGVGSTEVISVQAGGLNSYGPPGSGASNPLTIKDLETIERVNNVERAVRRNLPSGKLEYNNKVIFGIALSVPDRENRKFVYDEINLDPIQGRMLQDGDTNKVVLGYNFYIDGVGLDKKVESGNKVILQDQKVEVVGILKKKGSFVYDNIVLMNEKPLENLMKYGDEVDLISVKVKNKDQIEQTKSDIEKALRKSRNVKEGEEDFEVSTPAQSMATVNSLLTGIQIFIFLIASISIVVGAIGIVNTMTTSVLERKKEIGIMKAIGARNVDIFGMFFVESGLMGLIGGGIGVALGIIIGYAGTLGLNSWLGASTSPSINLPLIFLTLLASFLIGSVAGITPALKAAHQEPVEALRS